MKSSRVAYVCVLVIAVWFLAGCGVVSQIQEGMAHSNAAAESIEKQVGQKPQISFNTMNGTLMRVSVDFPQAPSTPLPALEKIVRASVVHEFRDEPESLVIAFSYAKGYQPPTNDAAETSTAPDSAVVAAGVDSPRAIEAQTGGDVEQMLDQADAYKNHGTTSREDMGRNLSGPPDSNAIDLYHKVLAIQPDNQRAIQGLKDIAAFYADLARKSCGNQSFGGCGIMAADGLRAEPDDAVLQDLKRRADQGASGNASRN